MPSLPSCMNIAPERFTNLSTRWMSKDWESVVDDIPSAILVCQARAHHYVHTIGFAWILLRRRENRYLIVRLIESAWELSLQRASFNNKLTLSSAAPSQEWVDRHLSIAFHLQSKLEHL
eukprot:GILJ01008899.1.p1 GENE.GILJ01008899.1~~GILJ01008899.1.p1  ORF type:complete len:119 (+),score=5.16 GILJ01008899.1:297-653(+)